MIPLRRNYRIMREKFDTAHVVVFETQKNKFITYDDSAQFIHGELGLPIYTNKEGLLGLTFNRDDLPDDITLWYIDKEENCYGIFKEDLEIESNEEEYDSSQTYQIEPEDEFIHCESTKVEETHPDQAGASNHRTFGKRQETNDIKRTCFNCRFQDNDERCPHMVHNRVCEEWSYRPVINREAYDNRNHVRNRRSHQTTPESWESQYFNPQN